MERERETGYLFAEALPVIGGVGCIRLGQGGKANEVLCMWQASKVQHPAGGRRCIHAAPDIFTESKRSERGEGGLARTKAGAFLPRVYTPD